MVDRIVNRSGTGSSSDVSLDIIISKMGDGAVYVASVGVVGNSVKRSGDAVLRVISDMVVDSNVVLRFTGSIRYSGGQQYRPAFYG